MQVARTFVQKATRQAAQDGLESAGDALVGLVHHAVKGHGMKGDPEDALQRLVDEGALSPEAALYVGGIREIIGSLSRSLTQPP